MVHLTMVTYVTPNYVGFRSGQELALVHKSQVVGAPSVGDWVEVRGTGMDAHLKLVHSEPTTFEFARAV